MNLDHGAWVILAGERRFLLLRNSGCGGSVELEIYEQGTCNRDQAPVSVSGASASALRVSGSADVIPLPGQAGEKGVAARDGVSFTDRTGAKLRAWVASGRGPQLVVVADRATLERLRKTYDADLRWAIVAEIPRDLTSLPLAHIEAEIRAYPFG